LKYHLEGKIFNSISNTRGGEVGIETVFYYHQKGNIVWAEYEGGEVEKGHLIAKVLESDQLDMRYQHINRQGQIMIGQCLSTPEILESGKLKFKEQWQWLCGNNSTGYSEIIEQ